jgi:hypothetical protein
MDAFDEYLLDETEGEWRLDDWNAQPEDLDYTAIDDTAEAFELSGYEV